MQSANPRRVGRYEILSSLAQGGMAELFVAKLAGIEGFAKRVVLKRVLPSLARDRQFVEMFLEEARLAATLHHQNVVQVIDIGEDDDGYFFAMELLHGGDVGDVLRTTKDLPLDIALELARASCAGLHYAHERTSPTGTSLGIVHRDVSPQNLYVTFDGGLKVLDFGIAKAVHQITNHYTRSGTLRGKLPYMSPEQCQGEPIDRRSDIFSMAIVIWEMTVGERLFGAGGQSDFEILKSIVERDAVRPSQRKASYPQALERIVMKGLMRDRDARYQSADDMQADLEQFMRATSNWASPRDVAKLMRGLFPQRAAEWQRAERVETQPKADILPFPRPVTREVSQPETTVDLPRDRISQPPAPPPVVAPPPAATQTPPTTPTTAPPSRAGRIAMLAGAAIVLVAAAGAIGYLARGNRSVEEGPAAAPAKKKKPKAGPVTDAPRDPTSEDIHWFQPDDYMVAKEKFKGGRLDHVRVAKMMREPLETSARKEAGFLTGGGVEITTDAYWKTRPATAEDLEIGTLAFCYTEPYYDEDPRAPESKHDSRTNDWAAGKVTDVADLGSAKVQVANMVCSLNAVRVVDE
jgi:serine/threonine protein kinase